MGYQRLKDPTKAQRELAKWLAGVAASPIGLDYLPLQFVPQRTDGQGFSQGDYVIAAELATSHILGKCIMYLPQTEAFYFQPILAAFPVVPIGGKAG